RAHLQFVRLPKESLYHFPCRKQHPPINLPPPPAPRSALVLRSPEPVEGSTVEGAETPECLYLGLWNVVGLPSTQAS
ncbi:MAG: hypothetical protein LUQ65_01415, partial [Candidatus Helarchaeota archaeon]|nr:hypothetical protein [Candidatus Helarchaeota archaeon]